MKIKDVIGAIFSGIVISVKRMQTFNCAIKLINRKAYDKSIDEEYSVLEEMYSNPLFVQLLDSAFWNDTPLEKKKRKRGQSVLTDTERSIANYYLIWKENETKSLDNSAVE